MSQTAVMVIRIELADGEELVSATMTSSHHISSTCTTVSMGDTHGGICKAATDCLQVFKSANRIEQDEVSRGLMPHELEWAVSV